jgi:outer membrane murein-binding lipoprotein Lpp
MTGGQHNATAPDLTPPSKAGDVTHHVPNRLTDWASAATFLGLFITVGGLIFSAGYFVSGVRGDSQISKLQATQSQFVALETDVKHIRQDLQTAKETNGKLENELTALNEAITAAETEAGARYDQIRSESIIQMRRICTRLNDEIFVQQCLEDIDYLIECFNTNKLPPDLSACETWPDRQRQLRRPR